MLMEHTRPPLFTHNEADMQSLKAQHKEDMEAAALAVMSEVRKSETSLESQIMLVIEESKERTQDVMRTSLAEMATEMCE